MGRSPLGLRAALVAWLVAWAACAEPSADDGAGDAGGVRAPEALDSDQAPPLASEDPTDTATWSIGITEAPPTVPAPPTTVVTALRTGTHADRVRVTFEMDAEAVAARPGYHLEYVDRPLIACGSGEQIFPVGDAWLRIRMSPAAAHTDQGQATLGAREMPVEGPLLLRIYRTCDFEGVVTHVLALSTPNPYRVATLENPLRIVVDVQR